MKPRTITGWFLCLALHGVVTAQDEANRQYEALLKAYDQAITEYRAKLSELNRSEEYLEARQKRDTAKINELRASIDEPTASFVPKFQAGASRFAGREGAVPYLIWLVSTSRDRDASQKALDTLLEEHVASPAIAPLVVNDPYTLTMRSGLTKEQALAALAKLIDEGATDEIRAHALYARALHAQRDREATDEEKSAAEADLKRARQLSEGTLLADRIDAPEFERKHLQIGMKAPDIVGKDVDGVEFKLSDYRGKVVVLDFWGDW